LFKSEIISKEKARALNPVVLAFVGDAVYTLIVREELVLAHDFKTGELNKLSANEVCAQSQADKIDAIFDKLTEDEVDIFKRARNAKKPTKSKSAPVAVYNKSTGFEAVIGYLYLTGQKDRINELLFFGDK